MKIIEKFFYFKKVLYICNMKELVFQQDLRHGISLTTCPFDKNNTLDNAIFIGSISCRNCKHFAYLSGSRVGCQHP